MATVNHAGRKLNIIARKGTAKEVKTQDVIIKHLTSKGIIRTEGGHEFSDAELYNVGKGLFINIAKPLPASAKPAATENVKKTAAAAPAAKAPVAGRAPALPVTADQIEGKKVNGIPVEKQIRSKGIVILEGGERIELANIVRRGKGFVTADAGPVAAPAAKAPAAKTAAPKGGATAKGGAVAKTVSTASAIDALFSEPGLLTTKDVRGKVVAIDGEDETVETTYKSGRVVCVSGAEFQIEDVRTSLVGGGFAVISEAYIEELEELHAAQLAKAAKVSAKAPAAVTRNEVKNQPLRVGKVEHTVIRTFKNNTVETDRGFKCSVEEIARDGAAFVYTGKDLPRTGTSVPRNRIAPSPTVKKLDVDAFDYDTTLDVRDHLRESILIALKETYNIDLVSATATQNGSNMMTVTFALAATDANKADIARKVKELEGGFAQLQQAQGHDFGSHELLPKDDEEEEEEPETDEEEEEEPESFDDEEEEEPEAFDEEEEEEPESDDEEEEEEPESFEEEEEAETTFPLDTTELVENAKARLEKLMPGRNLAAYVKLWYATQDVFDIICYEIEPGHTVAMDDKQYVLVGLNKDGSPLLVGVDKPVARAGVTLDSLLEAVQEGE